jgi:CBS domain-containing protein
VSKAFALLFGIFGIFGILQFNILLMLIAFFVYFTAQGELLFLVSKGLLKGLHVGEVALRVDPVDASATLQEVAARMMKARQVLLPVRMRSGAAAIVSMGDLKRVDREHWRILPVQDVVRPSAKTLESTDLISTVLPEILHAANNALPVTQDGKIIGLITYPEISSVLQVRSLDEQSFVEDERKAG